MKNNIINILLLLITLLFTMCFNNVFYDKLLFVVPLVISISIIMMYKKRNNKIYNIISIILLIFSILYCLTIIYSIVSCTIDYHCSNNFGTLGTVLLFTSLITLLLINIIDIRIVNKKSYYVISYIINIIVIIIHLRYYFDYSLWHNYVKLNQNEIQYSYIYITQNYIYFNILYISLLIYYLINKKNKI